MPNLVRKIFVQPTVRAQPTSLAKNTDNKFKYPIVRTKNRRWRTMQKTTAFVIKHNLRHTAHSKRKKVNKVS